MPQLDTLLALLAQLAVAVASGGWASLLALGGLGAVLIFLYWKVRSLYRQYIQQENQRRQQEAQAQNPVQNKADEDAHKKAEGEIEDILKGGT